MSFPGADRAARLALAGFVRLAEHPGPAGGTTAPSDRAGRRRCGVSLRAGPPNVPTSSKRAALGCGAGYTADFASSNQPPGRSAGAPSGACSSAPAKALPLAVGVCSRPGVQAAVQRFVHDMASLQYHRISAHACPPSGTSRPSGSAMPHNEHCATSSARSRLRRVAVGRSVSAGAGLTGSCSRPVSRYTGVTDEADWAMDSST
jgi:hypothetical protein